MYAKELVMKNKFITYLTIFTYMFLSILSYNNDVVCVHESGHVSFESIINSTCVDFNINQNQNKTVELDNKISKSDICCDIEILKGIISYQSSLFSNTLLSYNSVITDYIRYIRPLDIDINQDFYVLNTKNKDFIEKSHCNHISTFVLLT